MRSFGFAALVGVAVLVGACGDDDRPSSGPANPTAVGDTAVTAPAVTEVAVVEVDGVEVFAVERSPSTPSSLPTVLFLHGAAFTSQVWVDTGILDDTAAAGFRSVAVDLPGFGNTASVDGGRGVFLGGLIDAVDDGDGVVVVSPSMSGSFSLALLASGVPDALRGFVPVAPVNIAGFADGLDQPVDGLPTLIVWGADDGLDIGLAERLRAALPDSSIEIIDDAGHAAYRDQPAAFVRLLTDFAADL